MNRFLKFVVLSVAICLAVEFYNWLSPSGRYISGIAGYAATLGALVLCRLPFSQKKTERLCCLGISVGIVVVISVIAGVMDKLSAWGSGFEKWADKLPMFFQVPVMLLAMTAMVGGFFLFLLVVISWMWITITSFAIGDDEIAVF